MSRAWVWAGAGAAILLASGPALADEAADAAAAAAAEAAEAERNTVLVTGHRGGYDAGLSSSSTHTPTLLRDTPQAVMVVSEVLIEDAAVRSIGDLLRFVPGATQGQGEGHRDQITLRGNNTTADFFVDGLRDDVQYFRPLYNLERVEVLKGANALAFGRGGGGGVVNRVTKTAGLEESFATLFGGVDTFGAYAIEGDFNAALTDQVAVRLNTFYEDARNHRDVFELERFGFNPTLTYAPSHRTRFVLSYEYLDDFRIIDRGVPSVGGFPIAGFQNAFFGDPDANVSDFNAHVLRLRGEHDFGENLTLSGQFVYGDYDKAYRNAFSATAVSFDPVSGAGSLGVEAYFDPTERRNLFGQINLAWRVRTGPIGHTWLVGVEAGDQRTDNQRINGFFDSGVPTTSSGRRTVTALSNPLSIPPITFRAGAGNRSVLSDAEIVSVYIQDQAAWGPFELIVGGRYDRFDLTVDDRLAGQSFSRVDTVFSPRAGLVYKPIEPVSLYASYSRSFLPQSGDQFLSLDPSLEALEPERFDTYEIGAKWDILERLAFTAALYQLERTNTRAPSGQAGVVVLTGEARSRGLELSLSGQLSRRWSAVAAYTLQEAEITAGTTAAPAGREAAQTPTHIFTAWSRYDLSRRFGVGLGVTHQSDSFAAISNATVLPSYTRLDAALYFGLTDRLEAQINIENLTDADYFPTAHTDNNISTGAPVNARFSLRARF